MLAENHETRSHTTAASIQPGTRWQTARQRVAEIVRRHANALPPDEAALVRAVYVSGHSIAALSRLTGECVHSIRRRLRRLERRLLAPEFEFVVEERGRWPLLRRQVGEAYFLRGRTIGQVAAELRLSAHVVREQRVAISALCEGVRP